MIRLACAAALLAACTPRSPQPRFANATIAVAVDDRRDVPKPPAKRRIVGALYHFDGSFARRAERAMELHAPRRARGINALDEVPDSTWFTNRVGVRDVPPDELRIGPSSDAGPEAHKPWTIRSTKVVGVAPGILVQDARGARYLMKFDRRGYPEIETAAHVIANRLLWGLGYNVPDDRIVYLRRGDLLITKDSIARDVIGNERAFEPADLETILASVEIEPDGTIRAMASRILDGEALGGHPGEGVRADDPNDRIPHELRRDLRGTLPMFAWLDRVDVKDDNSLDMWVADRADPRRHYVEHYLLDFGDALGAQTAIELDPRSGHEYAVDPLEMFGSLVWFGARPRTWENLAWPQLRGLGAYTADHFDPGTWKAYTPAYVPIGLADRADWFWGAKALARFTPAQLRAAVDAGMLTDPRAADYLVRTLIARQRAVARYAFERINPTDRFTVDGARLCFDDLMLAHGLAQAATYQVRTLDRSGRPLGERRTFAAERGGHTCTPLALARTGDGYTIAELVAGPHATAVHLARDPRTAAWRVIGVWRD